MLTRFLLLPTTKNANTQGNNGKKGGHDRRRETERDIVKGKPECRSVMDMLDITVLKWNLPSAYVGTSK